MAQLKTCDICNTAIEGPSTDKFRPNAQLTQVPTVEAKIVELIYEEVNRKLNLGLETDVCLICENKFKAVIDAYKGGLVATIKDCLEVTAAEDFQSIVNDVNS